MANLLREEMPQVEYVTAVGPVSWPGYDRFTLSVEEKAIHAAGQYVGKDYFNIFSYELIIGNEDLPVSYFIAKNWLEGFAYRIDLAWWYFAGAGLLALLIAWFTVGLQTVKAARVNPVECLRDE